ncbi:hypothetical protein [Paucibacter sp. DJ2R-2]|uniref:hypothetical protein n=1 Tax=Paucibacter sp. DJ2R-2 TaxID=2893558 RepID=UPI0021E4DA9E|nr:hypothetical protein [Paucibacter sp. DJ2R-2]MCV2420018.1 hypothetical protein [Paucibacter sp. DJ4R-1]
MSSAKAPPGVPAWTSSVRRAALAALEASEAIQAAGGGRLLVIRGSFDEFKSTWSCGTRASRCGWEHRVQGRAMVQRAQQRQKRRWIWML